VYVCRGWNTRLLDDERRHLMPARGQPGGADPVLPMNAAAIAPANHAPGVYKADSLQLPGATMNPTTKITALAFGAEAVLMLNVPPQPVETPPSQAEPSDD